MAQPQTQDVANPHLIVQVNAKWTNGVAPGYRPTAGAGLVLNLSAGTSFARNVRASYAGGTLSLTNNATNYIFLDTTSSNAPGFNTSGYPTTGIPIATVVTASGAITTITDDRTPFDPPLPGGTNHQTQINAAGAFGGVGPGTAGQYLRSGGASADPAYASIAESEVTGLVSDLAGKVPATRQINTTAPLTGGGDLSADRTLGISAATATQAGAVPTPPNDATKYLDGTANWSKPTAGLVGLAGIVIDGGGSVLATGSKRYRRVNYAGTITGWTLLADQSGSAQITVKKCTYAGYPTTASIVASAPPNLSSAQKNQSSTLTGWTISFAAGDIFEFNLDSVSSCTWLSLDLDTTRS